MSRYRCWDECTRSGCPTHEIDVLRQNSVMLLHFLEDGKECLLISEVKFKAMMNAYADKYTDTPNPAPPATPPA